MIPNQRCETCRFWKDHDDVASHREAAANPDLSQLVGECRRHAPRLVLADVQPNADMACADSVVWPLTSPLDWCGDYEPAEAGRRP